MPSLQIHKYHAFTTIKPWNVQVLNIDLLNRYNVKYIFEKNVCFVVNSENSEFGDVGSCYRSKNSIRITIPMCVVKKMRLKHKTQVEWINREHKLIFRERIME